MRFFLRNTLLLMALGACGGAIVIGFTSAIRAVAHALFGVDLAKLPSPFDRLDLWILVACLPVALSALKRWWPRSIAKISHALDADIPENFSPLVPVVHGASLVIGLAVAMLAFHYTGRLTAAAFLRFHQPPIHF
jgi:hypothetical protein